MWTPNTQIEETPHSRQHCLKRFILFDYISVDWVKHPRNFQGISYCPFARVGPSSWALRKEMQAWNLVIASQAFYSSCKSPKISEYIWKFWNYFRKSLPERRVNAKCLSSLFSAFQRTYQPQFNKVIWLWRCHRTFPPSNLRPTPSFFFHEGEVAVDFRMLLGGNNPHPFFKGRGGGETLKKRGDTIYFFWGKIPVCSIDEDSKSFLGTNFSCGLVLRPLYSTAFFCASSNLKLPSLQGLQLLYSFLPEALLGPISIQHTFLFSPLCLDSLLHVFCLHSLFHCDDHFLHACTSVSQASWDGSLCQHQGGISVLRVPAACSWECNRSQQRAFFGESNNWPPRSVTSRRCVFFPASPSLTPNVVSIPENFLYFLMAPKQSSLRAFICVQFGGTFLVQLI